MTSQYLALESKSLLWFSFFSLRCCDGPSLKNYILFSGEVSRAFVWEPSLPSRTRSARPDCVAHAQGHTCMTRARAGVTGVICKVCSWRLGLLPTSANWSEKGIRHKPIRS